MPLEVSLGTPANIAESFCLKFIALGEINQIEPRWSRFMKRAKKDSFSRLMEGLSRRYGGQYAAVIDGRIVAVGRRQLSVYKKAEKGIPKDKEIGIYYIPSKSANPLLLKIR